MGPLLLLSLLCACEPWPSTRAPSEQAQREPLLAAESAALPVATPSEIATPSDASPQASATMVEATAKAAEPTRSTLVTSTPSAWSSPEDNTFKAVRESGNLVIHVYVPLCHNDQVDCGSSLAGKPDNLKHNLYWGAVFGQKRFFSRKSSKWSEVAIEKGSGNVLERAVYRRAFPGEPWGRAEPITAWVVFDALHGDAIDEAIDGLYREAASGGVLTLNDGEARVMPINVVGYAGHNRMMDGKKPPTTESTAAIPSFVFACYSRSYFEDELKQRGSTMLLSTRALMAPEGYVVDGLVAALAENAPRSELREAAASAYASWQKITLETAMRIF